MAGHARCHEVYSTPSPLKGYQMALHDTPNQDKPSTSSTPKRSLRGFAAMDPQRQREIASLGGRAAHQSGHAHEFTSEEARAAGKKRHARANVDASTGTR